MTDNGNSRRVMGIFAHPDDPEFFCGATFARWAAEGVHITFVLATSGDKGSADPEMTHDRLIEIREQEEQSAASVLGGQGGCLPALQRRRAVAHARPSARPHTAYPA
jgi:LmbE family N-acetylglucosaminyl deacetylase